MTDAKEEAVASELHEQIANVLQRSGRLIDVLDESSDYDAADAQEEDRHFYTLQVEMDL